MAQKKARRKGAKKRAAPRKRNARSSPKRSTINRKIRKSIKQRGRIDSKALYHASRHKQRYNKRHAPVTANPEPKKAKTNRWYKGPRGVKVRVRRVRGKFVVDIKK